MQGAPEGTTWVCARCEQPFQYRAPSDRAPERQRVRVDACSGCTREVLNRIERSGQLAAAVHMLGQRGGVRSVLPYRTRRPAQ